MQMLSFFLTGHAFEKLTVYTKRAIIPSNCRRRRLFFLLYLPNC